MANREVAAESLAQLGPSTRAHIQRLERATAILADLSRADLLVLLPADDDTYVTIRHRRPVNASTLYPHDQVGERLSAAQRPLLHIAYTTGTITDGGIWQEEYGRWIRTLAVPVRHNGEVVAVLAREFSPDIDSVPGSLQFVSFETLRRVAAMIAEGTYPYPVETRGHEHPPRVADGLILLDNRGAVEFASANAITNLTLLGVDREPRGHRLRELGVVQNTVRSAYTQLLPFVDEITSGPYTMTLACYPLLVDGGVAGAMVLLRDITDVRARDRLLLSKDATIAEIHHRVKNNLQTISSLLHLQSRRVDSDEAVNALSESVRRIRSIALVHEILSHSSGDELPFADIIQSLIRNVRDALIDDSAPVEFTIDSSDSVLPSDMSTTLAVVLSELLQNTIDHAFPTPRVGAFPTPRAGASPTQGAGAISGPTAGHRVNVAFDVSPTLARLVVTDNGVGFPTDFAIDSADGLGLTIVRTLVVSELNGTIEISTTESGNAVALAMPMVPAAPNQEQSA